MDIFFDEISKPKKSRSLPKPATFSSTPGRAKKDPFKNFLACFKQQNAWVERSRMRDMALEKWEKLDKTKRREFNPDRYKMGMRRKLVMATLARTPDSVRSEPIFVPRDLRSIPSARRLTNSQSNTYDDKAMDHSTPTEFQKKPPNKASFRDLSEGKSFLSCPGIDLNKLKDFSMIDLNQSRDYPRTVFNKLKDFPIIDLNKSKDQCNQGFSESEAWLLKNLDLIQNFHSNMGEECLLGDDRNKMKDCPGMDLNKLMDFLMDPNKSKDYSGIDFDKLKAFSMIDLNKSRDYPEVDFNRLQDFPIIDLNKPEDLRNRVFYRDFSESEAFILKNLDKSEKYPIDNTNMKEFLESDAFKKVINTPRMDLNKLKDFVMKDISETKHYLGIENKLNDFSVIDLNKSKDSPRVDFNRLKDFPIIDLTKSKDQRSQVSYSDIREGELCLLKNLNPLDDPNMKECLVSDAINRLKDYSEIDLNQKCHVPGENFNKLNDFPILDLNTLKECPKINWNEVKDFSIIDLILQENSPALDPKEKQECPTRNSIINKERPKNNLNKKKEYPKYSQNKSEYVQMNVEEMDDFSMEDLSNETTTDISNECSMEIEESSVGEVDKHGYSLEDLDRVESWSRDEISEAGDYSLPDLTKIDFDNLSNTSISPNEPPFINFLHDFSIRRKTKPVDSLEYAAFTWIQMKPEEKAAYEPENYVMKLFKENKTFSKILLNELMDLDDQDYELKEILSPSSAKARHLNKARKGGSVLKKPLKRLNTGLNASAKKSSSGSLRRTGRVTPFLNFLAYMRLRFKNTGFAHHTILSTALWCQMTPLERNQFHKFDLKTKESEEVFQHTLYELGKKLMVEAVQTMPTRVPESSRLSFSKFMQVSEQDWNNTKFTQDDEDNLFNSKSTQVSENSFWQAGSQTPNADSFCSHTPLPSAPLFSAQTTQSLNQSNVTSNFEERTVSDISDPSLSLQVADNSSQTMDNEYSLPSGKKWNFLKYLRKR